MARIITPAPEPQPAPGWTQAEEEVIILALDRNEAVAVRNALRGYRHATTDNTEPTSLNGSGARVYETLNPVVRANGWR